MWRLTILICIASVPWPGAAADTYTIDPSHTYPRWAASHFGFSTHRGQFNKTSGTLILDPKGGGGSIQVTVEAASVGTGDVKFDEHLRSADFFDATKHPTITFKSSAMRFEDGKPVSATGDFTMLGKTRPLTMQITNVHCAEGVKRCGTGHAGVHPATVRSRVTKPRGTSRCWHDQGGLGSLAACAADAPAASSPPVPGDSA